MDVVSLLISAAAGAGGGFFVRLRGLRHEELGRRFDDVCKDIDGAATLGTDYWLLGGGASGTAAMEARLLGFQHGISLGIANISEDHKHLDAECDKELVDFLDQLTGGDFQVAARQVDAERAVGAQIAARKLVAVIRRQRQAALRWWPISG